VSSRNGFHGRRRIVTHELERKVGFDRGAHVEVAADVQRPAAVVRLPGAQVDRDLVLERLIDLAEEVLEKDVFCGNRGIGLEIEDPVAICLLQVLESGPGFSDYLGEAIVSGSDGAKIRLRRCGPPCRAESVLEFLMSV
jgi:hypothetical protein